jgi:hypothetical protein
LVVISVAVVLIDRGRRVIRIVIIVGVTVILKVSLLLAQALVVLSVPGHGIAPSDFAAVAALSVVASRAATDPDVRGTVLPDAAAAQPFAADAVGRGALPAAGPVAGHALAAACSVPAVVPVAGRAVDRT